MSHFSNIDDLVQSVSLHIPRPVLFHGYVLPFLIIYGGWLYGWVLYGLEEFYEAGLLGIAAIALCQLLCCLTCYWSVHVHCFLTCRKVIYFCLRILPN